MNPTSHPIEQLSPHDLLREWDTAVKALATMAETNPNWEWKKVQPQLEHLHALAQELHRKKALERAKWQP